MLRVAEFFKVSPKQFMISHTPMKTEVLKNNFCAEIVPLSEIFHINGRSKNDKGV